MHALVVTMQQQQQGGLWKPWIRTAVATQADPVQDASVAGSALCRASEADAGAVSTAPIWSQHLALPWERMGMQGMPLSMYGPTGAGQELADVWCLLCPVMKHGCSAQGQAAQRPNGLSLWRPSANLWACRARSSLGRDLLLCWTGATDSGDLC